MTEATIWWILAGSAVIVELLTGTFYLLMLALGLSAGALAAHMGAGVVTQLVAAALVGGSAVTAWRVQRGRQPARVSPNADRDVNLDVGETVQVDAWNPDGTASVRYRGAQWIVVHRTGHVPSTGAHVVVEVVGSRLVVDKK